MAVLSPPHRPDPSKLLTLIITTSPTPSAPSTELLTAVFASFRAHCPVLLACRLVVVFDHYDQVVATRPRLKKGQISAEQAEAYSEYKDNVKNLVTRTFLTATTATAEPPVWASAQSEAESGSPVDKINKNSTTLEITSSVHSPSSSPSSQTLTDGHVTFIEPHRRIGFGLAVRSALRIASTPYVWIHQHDWTLAVPVPLSPMLEVMQSSRDDPVQPPVRYICLPSCRMLDYHMSDHVTRYPALNALTRELKRDFTTSSGEPVPLTPLFFWHDKPHIVDRDHYLSTVFPSRLSICRGEFIEDSIGQRARNQMKEGQWAKWACWLLYPSDLDTPFVRHIRGRTWRGTEAMKVLVEQQKLEGRQSGWKKQQKAELAALTKRIDTISLDHQSEKS